MARFGIILANCIVNKLYEQQTEGVKISFKTRITHLIIGRIGRGRGFPLVSRLFDDSRLRPGRLLRFIRLSLREFFAPERVITLRQQILESVIRAQKTSDLMRRNFYRWWFVDGAEGKKASSCTDAFRFI